MTVLNRLSLVVIGLLMLSVGGAGLLRGLGLWGDASGGVLPSDLLPEISANPWAVPVTAAIAAGIAITAVGVLLANITPRSRLLRVARSSEGTTQIRTPSLLSALRDDICHELAVTQVRSSMRGRGRKPRVDTWVVANSFDSPRELLTKLAEGPAPHARSATGEPLLPLYVYLRFPSGIGGGGRRGRTPVA